MTDEPITCSMCGEPTHDDESTLFDIFTVQGHVTERRCFECDPPDNEEGCGKWGCRDCYPDMD